MLLRRNIMLCPFLSALSPVCRIGLVPGSIQCRLEEETRCPSLLSNLNPEQLRAVSLPAQHALILAGAGSGKTRCSPPASPG